MAGLLAALLGAAAALNSLAGLRPPSGFSPPGPMRLAAEDAALNAALISLGMRRLAADLAFIHLIIYYGTPESRREEEPAYLRVEGGDYPELGPRALGALRLDPSFDYPILYAAGALAFNLHRSDEALDVLQAGLVVQPKNWKLHSYIGAVGFAKKGDPKGALARLEPILLEPDCPTMLKHLAAFMYLRLGRREAAIRLYREILDARDPAYRDTASQALRRLGAADKAAP